MVSPSWTRHARRVHFAMEGECKHGLRASACSFEGQNTLKTLIPSFDREVSIMPFFQKSSICVVTPAWRVTDVDVSMSGYTNFEGGHLMQLLLSDFSWLFW